MADEADMAQAQIEQSIEMAFKSRAREALRPIGVCRFCRERVGEALLFCSSECRDDWDREQKLRAQAGRGFV